MGGFLLAVEGEPLVDFAHGLMALAPIAVYLAALGVLNLSRRPRAVNGALDSFCFWTAVSGLIMIGPVELLVPQEVFRGEIRPLFWLLAWGFYISCLTMFVMLQRPRLVIYNAPASAIRGVLDEAAKEVDPQGQMLAGTVVLPERHLEISVEYFGMFRNVTLVSKGDYASLRDWAEFRKAVMRRIPDTPVMPNPRGLTFAVLACAISIILLMNWLQSPAEAMRSFRQLIGV